MPAMPSTVKVEPRERKNVTLGYIEGVNETVVGAFWVDFYSKALPCFPFPVPYPVARCPFRCSMTFWKWY